jgi:Tfp pilus assembly PilM family ATPase
MHAGLKPIAAELEAQAVLRMVGRRLSEQSALWRNASLTIIDVGGRNTHMYVVQNQHLQFIRSVRFGATLVADALANALEVSLAEAESYLLHPKTFLRPDGIVVVETDSVTSIGNIVPALEKLVREFMRLLRYFRSLHPERSYAGILDNLVLCGGLVGLRGFSEYLGKNLALRVEAARPFAGLLAEVDAEGFQEVTRRQEAYTVAVGLALSAIEHRNDLAGGNRHEREFYWQRFA